MYSELIYTRCGEGIDILKGKSSVHNSGFKVFSCSDNVTDAGYVDLPFLFSASQSKESYNDPDFMDDAYLYFVPDIGYRYLLNFHPVQFDREATGDYAHRPGNFINQVFIGSFEDFYLYETFGNETLWNAQKRGEAWYYENKPAPLPQRDDLSDSIGNICLDDISAFVSAGRRDALKKAIAFIIAQYSLPPEERKYLVIRDANSRNIELWIAAIESAFSPRMASGLSFATRLDKFTSSNKYTVNLSGQYQTQINIQSPNQKIRFRAMIVGVDERDRSNVSLAKALANSPFVVLDGNTLSLPVELDISDPYYRDITAFDDRHVDFCREFLQTINITEPTDNVLRLYAAYTHLSEYFSGRLLRNLLPALEILEKYQYINTPYLKSLYTAVREDLPDFLRSDPVSSFTVIIWLERCAGILGDISAKEEFVQIVSHTHADNVFMHPQNTRTKELHNAIKTGPFAQAAVAHLTATETVASFTDSFELYESADWTAFAKMFSDCLPGENKPFPETAATILSRSISALFGMRDYKSAEQIVRQFSEKSTDTTNSILLSEAQRNATTNHQFSDFLIWLVARTSPEITSDEHHLNAFCTKLQELGLEQFYSVVLTYKAKNTNHSQNMESFLNWINSNDKFRALDITHIIQALDKNLSFSDKGADQLAARLQSLRPAGLSLINSAHLYALALLDEKKFNITEHETPLNECAAQGFPSVENDDYADKLIDKLFNPKTSHDALSLVTYAAAKSNYYVNCITAEAVACANTKLADLAGCVADTAAETRSQLYFDAFVAECATLKQFDKCMDSIRENIRTRPGLQFFNAVEQRARQKHDLEKQPSLLGRLFGRKDK